MEDWGQTGVILGMVGVFGTAIMYMIRDSRRSLERQMDTRFDDQNERLKSIEADGKANNAGLHRVELKVARIEGHLGLPFSDSAPAPPQPAERELTHQ